MSIVLGVDVGGSTTKIVGLKDGELFGTLQVSAKDQVTSLYGAIGRFLREKDAALGGVSAIALTGVGASFIEEQIYGVKTCKVDEFLAIGRGALLLSGLDEALVVSMGTGTSLVRIDKYGVTRVGGSGIGGGTIIGLASQMIGKSDIDAILVLAENGSLANVDLLVRDIIGGDIPLLAPNLTAANFGKIKSTASESDLALGIVNMVFEVIGMLAVFALKNDTIRDVVMTGTLATFPQLTPILSSFSDITELNFRVPPEAVFATALGAAQVMRSTQPEG